MKLGYLIYTYDKPEFAKIQMDIVRDIWEPKFGKILICHTNTGKTAWYHKKYREDHLIRLPNPGHYAGAAIQIDAGIKYLQNKVDYIVVSAADTWLLNLDILAKYLKKMQSKGYTLLSCPWGTKARTSPADVGLATDFFIIDAKWQAKYKMFPANYSQFRDRYLDVIRYLGNGNVMYEKVVFMRFLNACFREVKSENALKNHFLSRYLEFKERMPIHLNNQWERPSSHTLLQMSMSHNKKEKIAFLKKYPDTKKLSSKLKYT